MSYRKNKICCIYTITNLINNKIYVGQTKSYLYRIAEHKRKLNKNIHINDYLQRSWNKYGSNNFMFEVLDECSVESLNELEHYWATLLNSHNKEYGYNEKPTNPYGKGGCSEETKLKISKANKGKISYLKGGHISQEMKDNLSKLRKGSKLTKETKDKVSKAMTGRIMTEEHKNKISIATKERMKEIRKCEICGKECTLFNYYKHHGKNCGIKYNNTKQK